MYFLYLDSKLSKMCVLRHDSTHEKTFKSCYMFSLYVLVQKMVLLLVCFFKLCVWSNCVLLARIYAMNFKLCVWNSAFVSAYVNHLLRKWRHRVILHLPCLMILKVRCVYFCIVFLKLMYKLCASYICSIPFIRLMLLVVSMELQMEWAQEKGAFFNSKYS
jgi:hypothetical protein